MLNIQGLTAATVPINPQNSTANKAIRIINGDLMDVVLGVYGYWRWWGKFMGFLSWCKGFCGGNKGRVWKGLDRLKE